MSALKPGTFARRRGAASRRRGHASQREGGQRRSLRVEPLEQRCLLDGALGHDAIELFNASPALLAGNGSSYVLPTTAPVASSTDTADGIASFRKVESPRVRSTEGAVSTDRLHLLPHSETKTQEQSTAVNRRELIKSRESQCRGNRSCPGGTP